MKISLAFVSLVLAGGISATKTPSDPIVTYPIPDGIANRTTFKTRVAPAGTSRWETVEAYSAVVTETNITSGGALNHDTSVAYFDFKAGTAVDVEITYQGTARVHNAQVRPYSLGIAPKVTGQQIRFRLTKPTNMIVQVNGDIWDCLHLFSNAIDANVPSANDSSVIYFGPGVHTVSGGTTHVASGQTVYVAGGAVVESNFAFQNVSDAVIRGRGVIYKPGTGGTLVEYSSNITVSDVIFLNPNGYTVVAGQSTGVTIRNIRSLSYAGWGDGIDVFCSNDVLIDGVFMRNSDDCVALYQHRNNYYGNSSNLVIQNSALWADLAHPINIGTHGNPASPETMDGVTILNVDAMRQHEKQQDYEGTIAINVGDANLVENVLVDGFRIEEIDIGQVINMRVMFNPSYNTAPGRGIRNVTIRNMSYNGTQATTSIFNGYDATRMIEGVTFENLILNGVHISENMAKPAWYLTTDYIPASVNSFVQNLTFT